MCMLREAFDDNGVFSKGRLTRIQQCDKCARMNLTVPSEHDEDMQLELHKNLVFEFETDPDSPLKLCSENSHTFLDWLKIFVIGFNPQHI